MLGQNPPIICLQQIAALYFKMNCFTLFKYSRINKNFIKSLSGNYVFCASLENLNDPFDCRVDIKKSAGNAISELDGEKKLTLEFFLKSFDNSLTLIQEKLSSVAVCSFSKDPEHTLLWSHYADDHKGVCVAYEIPEAFLNDPSKIIGIDSVDYGVDPLKKWFINNIPEERLNIDGFINELVKKVLFVKGKVWEYESEIRIIRELEGPFQLEKRHIKQICFGLNTPDSDIKLVKSLVEGIGHSVDYYKIVRGNGDFSISTSEI
jgi:hypothetical protein